MGVKYIYFSALSLIVLWNVAITSVSANEISRDPIYPNLKLVVTVEGKSYFIDDVTKSWFGAEEHCRSVGMYLANITSANQYTALKNAFAEQDILLKYVWVAAKDSEKLSQFAWMYSGDTPDDEYLELDGYMTVNPTCLWFNGRSLGRSTCYETGYMHSLCQLIAA